MVFPSTVVDKRLTTNCSKPARITDEISMTKREILAKSETLAKKRKANRRGPSKAQGRRSPANAALLVRHREALEEQEDNRIQKF